MEIIGRFRMWLGKHLVCKILCPEMHHVVKNSTLGIWSAILPAKKEGRLSDREVVLVAAHLRKIEQALGFAQKLSIE